MNKYQTMETRLYNVNRSSSSAMLRILDSPISLAELSLYAVSLNSACQWRLLQMRLLTHMIRMFTSLIWTMNMFSTAWKCT